MDIRINLVTPGTQLSTQSLSWVVADLKKIFEKGAIDGISKSIPEASKTHIKKEVIGKIDFYITDIRKGSWEFYLLSAVAGIVGKIFYDLAIDIIKDHSLFKNLKNKVNKTAAESIAEETKHRLDKREKLGPFFIESHKTTTVRKEDGTLVLEYKATLRRREDSLPAITSDEQLHKLLHDIEKK